MTAKSGSPPQSGQVPCVQPARSLRAMTASPARVRNGRIACCSTGSSPAASGLMGAAPGPDRFVPGADDRPAAARRRAQSASTRRKSGSSSASCLRIADAVAAEQEPHVAPVDRQVLELQDRSPDASSALR